MQTIDNIICYIVKKIIKLYLRWHYVINNDMEILVVLIRYIFTLYNQQMLNVSSNNYLVSTSLFLSDNSGTHPTHAIIKKNHSKSTPKHTPQSPLHPPYLTNFICDSKDIYSQTCRLVRFW